MIILISVQNSNGTPKNKTEGVPYILSKLQDRVDSNLRIVIYVQHKFCTWNIDKTEANIILNNNYSELVGQRSNS
jgi:hypothetical protein